MAHASASKLIARGRSGLETLHGTHKSREGISPLLVSFVAAATGELGDKTQLLLLVFAGYFRKPLPLIAGAILANLANNAISVVAGDYVHGALRPRIRRPILGIAFLGLALWAIESDMTIRLPQMATRYGPLLATLVTYFLADFGDKTQLATVTLAARYGEPLAVIFGSTLGSLVIDVPTVLLVRAAPGWAKPSWAHYAFPGAFGILGILTLCGFF